MSNYKEIWKQAKLDFGKHEKPAEKGKFLWVEFRKGTGIEDALKKVDALIPADMRNSIPDKKQQELEKCISDLHDAASSYFDVLTDSIKKEKEKNKDEDDKKWKDGVYRNLKILRQQLVVIEEKIDKDLQALKLARQAEDNEVAKDAKILFMQMGNIKNGLKAACHQNLLDVQKMLKNPTVKEYNGWVTAGSSGPRAITQNLAQLVKWAIKEEATVDMLRSRESTLEKHSKDLEIQIKTMIGIVHLVTKGAIVKHVKPAGTSTADQNLGMMCGSKALTLAPNASPEDIHAAIKNGKHQIASVLNDMGPLLNA